MSQLLKISLPDGSVREMPVGSVGEGGQVVQVLVDAGQWVRQGQVLAVIDRSVQSQQQAGQSAQIQVSEADARLAQARAHLASMPPSESVIREMRDGARY